MMAGIIQILFVAVAITSSSYSEVIKPKNIGDCKCVDILSDANAVECLDLARLSDWCKLEGVVESSFCQHSCTHCLHCTNQNTSIFHHNYQYKFDNKFQNLTWQNISSQGKNQQFFGFLNNDDNDENTDKFDNQLKQSHESLTDDNLVKLQQNAFSEQVDNFKVSKNLSITLIQNSTQRTNKNVVSNNALESQLNSQNPPQNYQDNIVNKNSGNNYNQLNSNYNKQKLALNNTNKISKLINSPNFSEHTNCNDDVNFNNNDCDDSNSTSDNLLPSLLGLTFFGFPVIALLLIALYFLFKYCCREYTEGQNRYYLPNNQSYQYLPQQDQQNLSSSYAQQYQQPEQIVIFQSNTRYEQQQHQLNPNIFNQSYNNDPQNNYNNQNQSGINTTGNNSSRHQMNLPNRSLRQLMNEYQNFLESGNSNIDGQENQTNSQQQILQSQQENYGTQNQASNSIQNNDSLNSDHQNSQNQPSNSIQNNDTLNRDHRNQSLGLGQSLILSSSEWYNYSTNNVNVDEPNRGHHQRSNHVVSQGVQSATKQNFGANFSRVSRMLFSLPSANLAERRKQGDCGICLVGLCEDLEEGDRAVVLPCFHVFHKDCIKAWLEAKRGDAKCPLCQANIQQPQ